MLSNVSGNDWGLVVSPPAYQLDTHGRSTSHALAALIPSSGRGKEHRIAETLSQEITHVNLQGSSIPSIIYEIGNDRPEISGDTPDAGAETKDKGMPYSFVVRVGDRGIVIEWMTSGDEDIVGFNIWRSEERDDLSAVSPTQAGGYLQINNSLITPPSDIDNPAQETRFSYTDTDIEEGLIYYYRLERISIDGEGTFLEPISIKQGARISQFEK